MELCKGCSQLLGFRLGASKNGQGKPGGRFLAYSGKLAEVLDYALQGRGDDLLCHGLKNLGKNIGKPWNIHAAGEFGHLFFANGFHLAECIVGGSSYEVL